MGKAYKWKSNDARLSETPVPPDMLALDVLIREKIKHIAQTSLPHTKGLFEIMKSKEDAWWAAHNKLLPSRKLLALYYENFRIDAPAINTMAMADLAAVNYLSFGDKNLEGFWEEWKKVSMSVAHCVAAKALNEMLLDKLTNSKILSDDVRDIKKIPGV